jgi:hypothetical protein
VELADHAAAKGVWLAIEPINRYEDYMTNTILADPAQHDLVSSGAETVQGLGIGWVVQCPLW